MTLSVQAFHPDGELSRQVVHIPAGERVGYAWLPHERDDLDGEDVTAYGLSIYGVRGVAARDYVGTVRVVDDDPTPTLAITPVREGASEGETVGWRARLSHPTEYFTGFVGSVVTGDGTHAELSSDDVDPDWLAERLHGEPLPDFPVPLSDLGVYLRLEIEPGQVEGVLEVPTVRDGRDEGTESLTVAVEPDGRLVPEPLSLVATVSDAT